MKAALLIQPGTIRVEDIAPPELRPGELLIRPSRTGVCGSDISFYRGHRTGTYPMLLGHELVGRVVETKAATQFHAGQRVIVEPNYPCGRCNLCLGGRGSICPNKASMGVTCAGCFADLVTAPAEYVWAVPDSISEEDAATIEPLAVALHALAVSGAGPGDCIAVAGCGVIGLLLVHAAARAGVKVIAHDRLPEKAQMAERLGACAATGEGAGAMWREANVTVVFECAGAASTVEMCISEAPRGSRVVLLGLSSSPARFEPLRLVREGISITPSLIYDHPADFRNAIELVARGELRPSSIVTATFGFAEIARAMELAATGRCGKVHVAAG